MAFQKSTKDKSIDLIRVEINKVWKELKKTSTKEELKKIRDDMEKARIEFNKFRISAKKFVTKDDLKNELNKYATKDDLKTELKKYATKDDLKRELNKYATKDDLDKRIQKSVDDLVEYIRFTNEQTKKELREDIVQFKDEILHELIKIREDLAVVIGYREHIEDHEVRIIKLEKSPSQN